MKLVPSVPLPQGQWGPFATRSSRAPLQPASACLLLRLLPGPQAGVSLAGVAALAAAGTRRAKRRRGLHAPKLCRSAGPWAKGLAEGKPSEALTDVEWPESWPYTPKDLSRQDETEDESFYKTERLVTHIDEGAIGALRKYYARVFGGYPGARILDLCSSWVSHYPEEKTWSHVSITGMNEAELSRNMQADDFSTQNLNVNPQLPYEDGSFDIVTCTVSFDYLSKPLEVMKEVGRVLAPGGRVILSTSNRCFPTKAVKIWLETNDSEHVLIYGSYIHYSGLFDPPTVEDISPPTAKVGFSDPIYVVVGRRQGVYKRRPDVDYP